MKMEHWNSCSVKKAKVKKSGQGSLYSSTFSGSILIWSEMTFSPSFMMTIRCSPSGTRRVNGVLSLNCSLTSWFWSQVSSLKYMAYSKYSPSIRTQTPSRSPMNLTPPVESSSPSAGRDKADTKKNRKNRMDRKRAHFCSMDSSA